jgi:MurNAc alpha-1-phosphate uridylyltransferase
MVLAAGRGERMGALTETLPKPLLDIGGETLIDRQIRLLAAAGIRDIVVNVSHLGAALRAHLGTGARYGVRIAYSDEGSPPLETAGGIIAALPLLGDSPFLVVNADVVTDFPFDRLKPTPGSGTLVLVPNPAHHAGGDFGCDAQGWATSATPRFTYAGISVLHPELFAGRRHGRLRLRPILDAAIAARRLRARIYSGLWIDVGTPERLTDARHALARPGS